MLFPATRRLQSALLLLKSQCRIHTTTIDVTEKSKFTSKRVEEYVNDAAKELGVTGYYCNRNPRSLELLGMAEKPKGFETARRRVDYYHRLSCLLLSIDMWTAASE